MSATASTMTTTLRAEGFACPSCVTKVEKALKKLDGVQDATVHFASSRIEIDHDLQRQSVDDLVAAVARAGYRAKASAF